MTKYITSLIYFIIGGVSFLYAQNGSFMMPYVGYAVNVTTIETNTVPSNSEVYSYYNIHGGAYLGILQKGESFSLGVDPSLNVGFSLPESSLYSDELAFDYNIHAPIFLLTRFLRGSNPYNRKPAGFGVGFGVIANAYKLTASNSLDQRASFIHPAMVLEGNFSTGRGHISVKFRMPIIQVSSSVKYSNALQNRDFNFTSWGLAVAYGFEKKHRNKD